MLYYIYDGSFDGLMTAIYDSYYRREQPDKIVKRNIFQQNLFDKYLYIDTDPVKSDKVCNAIRDKISKEALKNVLYVYLSEIEDSSTLIYHYVRAGFKIGRNIDRYLSNDTVLNIHKIKQKVANEAHRMLGLIRFRLLASGIYYAPISPDHNIIGLIASHFARRFADQFFIIHDVKRNISVVYDKKQWVITDIPPNPDMLIDSREETEYQNMWKEYFKNIAIKERLNPKLQRQYMPHRYWKYLVEK
ncbi:probable DNA metabolism protein [Caldanaerobius fijiensis DSM 17918]|uniref:Probable DNA metabolism protein n=1 Tax=Caldanaerobius fijiensis DSM 17918 TaxID=1121256 RepID=A0A1M5B5W9_9THEO|nr:TIGR03915 family putative DNA repair protein [Caldanaerobius fijiensis]SHF37858.1 probable DNA metabolism protein [Caldanaerobius fijiensis DSM 17918]